MASISKYKNKWRVQVYKNGHRASAVFALKMEAKAWAAEKEVEFANGGVAATDRTVGDLLDRYLNEVSVSKKGYRYEAIKIKSWQGSLLLKVRLDDLDASHIGAWRDLRLKSVMSSSVNRELNLMSAAFTRAVKEWRWLKKNPISDIQRPKDPKHRDRRISTDEIERLCSQAGFNGAIVESQTHLVVAMFLFAIETGMRCGEICGLKLGDYFDDYVVIRDSKNGDSRHVALSPKAKELSALIQGHSISPGVVSTLFRRLARRSELLDLHFHDSRHEACTRLARKLDVLDLARMIGHRDLKSLMIYYNATASDIAKRLVDPAP